MDHILHNRYYVQSQETKPLETISLFQVFESKQAVKSIWLQWFYKVLTTFRYKFIQYVYTSFNLWILFVIRIESSLIIFELFFSLAIQDKRDNSLISSDGNNISHVIPSQITTQDQNIISELELNAFKTFRIYNEGVFCWE